MTLPTERGLKCPRHPTKKGTVIPQNYAEKIPLKTQKKRKYIIQNLKDEYKICPRYSSASLSAERLIVSLKECPTTSVTYTWQRWIVADVSMS